MSKVILGIDVSKKELSLCLLKNERSYCKTVCNSENGFEEIINFISKKASEKPEVYLEATGSYSEPVSDFLFDHGFDVKVVNPMRIYSFSKTKLSRNKTDQSDAKLIAEYGSKFEEVSYRKMPENIKELRALYRCSLALKKQRAECKNHLEQRNTLPESVVKVWTNLLENIKTQIKNVNKSIMHIINSSADLKSKFENLCSIPAIGNITAIAILAEIQDVSKFDGARQLASFVGLTPRHRNSGTSVNCKPSIAKIGNAILRKALYLPALTAMKCNKYLAKFFEKLKERKKFHKQIMCAIMRKLIHIIFGVLKNNSKFNESLIINYA